MGSKRKKTHKQDSQLPLPLTKREYAEPSKIVNFQKCLNIKNERMDNSLREKIIDSLITSADKLDW